ncbi:MAG: 30S ribosomal protein S4, partial [Candidatus Micrarchaeota archaeon]|nr:30S ribosomal protein S4 [Candidatus Micrarchaeota archaeon]
ALRRIRREARRLLSKKGADLERRTSQLLGRVKRFLIRNPDATVDDVLLLTPRDILSRRLQTVVMRKHLARTNRQARQFIVHGHIAVGGNRVTSPSYLVSFEEEDHVSWFKTPLQVAPAATEAEPVAAASQEKDVSSDENAEPAKVAEAAPEAA